MADPVNTYSTSSYAQVIGFDQLDGSYVEIDIPAAANLLIGDDDLDNDLSDGTAGDDIKAAWEMVSMQIIDTDWFDVGYYSGYTLGGNPILYALTGDYYVFYDGPVPSGPAVASPEFSFSAVSALCFLPGTRLATPAGERAIETLAIGDWLTTASGAHKAVQWIGRMTLPLNRFTRATAVPVCVKAGALGNGLPRRDLYLSNDHALVIDGLLVQAGALVDGVNVVRCLEQAGDSVEYFHVELEEHAVILAEGMATESLWADEAIRAKFDNVAEFAALYPQHETTAALEMPRVKFARQVPRAIRRQVGAAAA